MSKNTNKTDEEWKAELTDEQYRVLREAGTEAPFTNQFYLHKENGIYKCAGCGQDLFSSDTKYDSGCGWPAFYAPIDSKNVTHREDKSHGMYRTEVLCSNCDGHLGHIFPDGPEPTGMRYCINSVSMDFNK